MKKKFLPILISCAALISVQAQDLNKSIEKENLDKGIILNYLDNSINQTRETAGLENLEFDSTLFYVAGNQVAYNAKQGKTSKDQSGGKTNLIKDRLEYFDGNRKAEVIEILFDAKYHKKGKGFSYDKVVKDLNTSLKKSKYQKIINGENFVFLGGNVEVGEKKLFVSYVLGDVNAFNNPTAHLSELDYPYTNKNKYGLKKGWNFSSSWKRTFSPWNGCWNENPKEISRLAFEGLYVKGKEVYVKADYIKDFKRLLPNKSDAFIVDVIDPAQFEVANNYNITNPDLLGRGFLLKPVFQKTVYANGNDEDLLIGNLPTELKETPDFNIFLYKSKDCGGYMDRSYMNGTKIFDLTEDYAPTPLELVYDTAGTVLPKFAPKSNQISFNIPFEKGKFDFKKSDIQPLIDSLGEPQFIITQMNISAYSSIEGNAETNDKLQIKRSESISGVLAGMNSRKKFKTEIKTNTGWNKFQLQIKGTEFAHLADSSFETVNRMIDESDSLELALEPFLNKQRFAQVTMFVTYKEKDMKKQDYFLFKYKKALERNNPKIALIFQNQLMLMGEYEMIASVGVPTTPDFGTLHGNLLYAYKKAGFYEGNFNGLYENAKELYRLYPNNRIVRFNFTSLAMNELIINSPEAAEGEEKITALRTISNEINADNIIEQEAIAMQKIKLFYFEEKYLPKTAQELAFSKKARKKKKKKKTEVNNTIQVTNMNDAICFADLYVNQGKMNTAYSLLRGNFNKFSNEMKNVHNEEEVALAEQYLVRMIAYYGILNKVPNHLDESDVYTLLGKTSPSFHNKLFDEKYLSIQYFENLHIKRAYRNALKPGNEPLGL